MSHKSYEQSMKKNGGSDERRVKTIVSANEPGREMNWEPLKRILCEIEPSHMDRLLQQFSGLDRLSGTPDANAAVDYLLDRLSEFGVEHYCLEFPAYLSDPLDSSLVLLENGQEQSFPCRPRSFSESCPDGITGKLWFDSEETIDAIKDRDDLRGRIVVSGNYDEDYAKALSDLGAAALIQVWKSDEDIVHEDTVGTVWGAPTEKTEPSLVRIPVIGVTHQTGVRLRKAAARTCGEVSGYNDAANHDLQAPDPENPDLQGPMARLTSRLRCHVQTLRLPIAVIRGKRKEFVLLSGHYDSWYFGATDNGTGNALCLELTRLFQMEQQSLEFGVAVAWWPGHSNGRYAGSTWFCDHYWKEINDHCIAHINIDSPGCLGADRVVIGTTRFEGTAFTDKIIRRHTCYAPKGYSQLFKGADQSFFGCRIPIHIYPMYKQSPDNKQYASPGSGGGWWWHTPADTLDKVDMDILLRDTAYIADMLGQIAFSPVIPADCGEYFSYIREIFRDYEEHSELEFEFIEIQNIITRLEETTAVALKKTASDPARQNRILKAVGGELNRLMNTYSERYEMDRAMPARLFPGLGIVKGISRESCDEKRYLFIMTEFVRQRNRLVCEIERLEGEIRSLLAETRAENLLAEHLPTEKLSSENLPTEKLSSENLPTENLPSENLSTEKLAAESLSTEKLTDGKE